MTTASNEQNHYPLKLTFADAATAKQVEFSGTADFNHYGDLAGLEILDMKRQLVGGALPERSPTAPRWSYDESIDAFYVAASEEHSSRQASAHGVLQLSASGVLVAIEFDTD